MSLIDLPIARGGHVDQPAAGLTVRAMQIGQHVIAVALTAVGAIRAISDGATVAGVVVIAVLLLVWNSLGAVLPRWSRSLVDRRESLVDHSAQHWGGRDGSARAGSVSSKQLALHTSTAATWWLVGLALLWSIAVMVSAEFVWVAFLLWLLAGHLLPGWWSVVFSTLVFGLVTVAPLIHHGSTTYANIVGPLIGGMFALGISRGYLQLLRDGAERERLVASLRQAQQEMTDLQDELVLAQRRSGATAERTRLARDIHDTIAQSLSSIRLIAHAETTRTLGRTEVAGDPTAAAWNSTDNARDPASGTTSVQAANEPGTNTPALEQIEALARDSLTDVRRIIAKLAPSELDNGALATALQRLLDRVRTETKIATELHVDKSLPALSADVEIALLRTSQSALANVRLHARASHVVVSLIDGGSDVRLDIVDDGVGFDSAEFGTAGWDEGKSVTQSSYGLQFMRSRLRELGGGLEIESAPGEGVALSAHVPISALTRPESASSMIASLDDSSADDVSNTVTTATVTTATVTTAPNPMETP